MQLIHVFRFLGIVALLMVPATAAFAKDAGPTEKITIISPSMQGMIEVTSADMLASLELSRLKGDASQPPPPTGGSIYLLTYDARHGDAPDAGLAANDVANYVPNPSGGPGYLYWDGWFQISAEGEAVLQRVIHQHAEGANNVQALPQTGILPRTSIFLIGCSGFLVLLGGWLLHRQRIMNV